AGSGRGAERIDQRRSHQLLGGGAVERARPGAVDGIRSDGLPAARADRRQVLEPARGGAERAAPELREPSLRSRRHGDRLGALSSRSSVSLADDRRRRRHPRRAHRRRARVLPALLPSGQRVACAGGGHRSRDGRADGGGILRRDPGGGEAGTGHGGAARASGGGSQAGARGSRRAAAAPTGRGVEVVAGLRRLCVAWRAPALFADGDAELDLVAEVLSSGKTSRLYRALVYEQRIATEVAASQNSREAGSFFQIVATAAPGRTLAEVERAIAKELAAFSEK